MIAAASVFFASLIGLAFLFTLKAIETKRGQVYLPGFRASGDEAALSLKRWLKNLRVILSHIPPALVLVGRILLRELALGAAKLARLTEAQLHKIADLVSHKRSFEKRSDRQGEPRSEFLKQVIEHKNGNGNGHSEDEKKIGSE